MKPVIATLFFLACSVLYCFATPVTADAGDFGCAGAAVHCSGLAAPAVRVVAVADCGARFGVRERMATRRADRQMRREIRKASRVSCGGVVSVNVGCSG